MASQFDTTSKKRDAKGDDRGNSKIWRRPKIPRMQERVDAFDEVQAAFKSGGGGMCSHSNGWVSGTLTGFVAPGDEETVLLAGPFSYQRGVVDLDELFHPLNYHMRNQLGLPTGYEHERAWNEMIKPVRDDDHKQLSIHLRLKAFRNALQMHNNAAKQLVFYLLSLQELATVVGFVSSSPFPGGEGEVGGGNQFKCDTTDVDVDVLGKPKALDGKIEPFPHQLSMAALALRQFDRAPVEIKDRFSPDWAHGLVFCNELDAEGGPNQRCSDFVHSTNVGRNFLLPGLFDTSDVSNGKTGSVILFVAAMAERTVEERLAFYQRAKGNLRHFFPRRLVQHLDEAKRRPKPVVPVLIVVPVHLARQWSDEFVRWAPSLKVLTICEKKDLFRESNEQIAVLDALIVSVNQLSNVHDAIPHFVFPVMVVDEARSTLKLIRSGKSGNHWPAHYGRWFLSADHSATGVWSRHLVMDTKRSRPIDAILDGSLRPKTLLHGIFHDIVPVRHNANPHMRTEVRHHVHASPLLPEERLLISERAMRTVRGVAFPKTAHDGDGDAMNSSEVTMMTHRQLLERMVDSRRKHLERLEQQMEDANKNVEALDTFFASEAAAALPEAQRHVFCVQQQQQRTLIANAKAKAESVRTQLVFREASVAALQDAQNAECPICMGSNEEEPLAMLPGCAHVFGAACLAEWAKKNRSCPQCRHKPAIWEVFALEKARRKGGEEEGDFEREKEKKRLQQLHGSKVAEVLMHILTRPKTHRFLVAAKYDATAAQLCHALELDSIKTVRVMGDATSQRRAMNKFTHKDSTDRVLVVSDTAAASGSNLQSCVDQVLMTHVPCEFDHSYSSREQPDLRFIRQTIGRAARGLRKDLDVHWFVTADTVEEKMYREKVAPELSA